MGILDDIASPFESFWNTFTGDPKGIQAAYDKAMGVEQAGSKHIESFLNDRRNQALQFYAPLQRMFAANFGDGTMAPAQAPRVPGAGPLTTMYGGK